MTENNPTPAKPRSVVKYVLRVIGGHADGKEIAAKNKAAARAALEALSLVADNIKIEKRLVREVSLADLQTTPRKPTTGGVPSTRKTGKR